MATFLTAEEDDGTPRGNKSEVDRQRLANAEGADTDAAMLDAARVESLRTLEQSALEAAVAQSRRLAELEQFREAHECDLALARSRAEQRARRQCQRTNRAAEEHAVAAEAAAAEYPVAAPTPPCGLALAIPTPVLRQLLLTGTTYDNLAVHVATCAQVHPEWRRVVHDSPVYLSAIIGQRHRTTLLRHITAAVQGSTPSLQILARDRAARIRLGQVPLGRDGARTLGAVLSAMETPLPVYELDLSNCSLTGTEVEPIAAALWQTASIQVPGRIHSLLLASNSKLGDNGLRAVIAALPPSLTKLDVSDVGEKTPSLLQHSL